MISMKKDILYQIEVDHTRDALLTDFGKAVLSDRYLLESESFQGLFARVASYYANDKAHARRLYDYISKIWFMPATPVLSNGGTRRGLPISCFLNEVNDDLHGIVNIWNENVWLASSGGGIGTYWGNVRSIGEKVRGNGRTSGIVPFICVQDSLALAVSQGNLRRGSSAVYLPIWHPEIEEFIEIRRPTGGDHNRKALNLHHGVVITNDFMEAVLNDGAWELKSPKDGSTVTVVRARDLWIRLLLARIETGEPYLLFIDHVNNALPEVYKKLGLSTKTSNLCSEITLHTGVDHIGQQRTAVCCLSSLNLEKYEEWQDNDLFIVDIMHFLDNVLQDFIDNASDEHSAARYAAMRERSIGLGVMGWHSFLQSKMIPIESVMAKVWNRKIFAHIKKEADRASNLLAKEKGPCPDAAEAGLMERFSHKTAIAPTASISIIAANSSPGIEPYAANAYTQRTLSGSFNVRNKHLRILLQQKGHDNDETWSSIMNHEGSIQHLPFFSQEEKEVFKTAFEINQKWLVSLAADRTPYICQAQSLNLFLAADIHKKDLHEIHFMAWKQGIKSLYYLRSQSLQRGDKVSMEAKVHSAHQLEMPLPIIAKGQVAVKDHNKLSIVDQAIKMNPPKEGRRVEINEDDECLACQ